MEEAAAAGVQIKIGAKEHQDAKAKAQAAPAAPAAAPAAGGLFGAAPAAANDTMPPKSEATEPPKTEATEAGANSKEALASNLSSLAAASMLAQVCERAFIEHQLAARHFAFYSFCERVTFPLQTDP